MTVGYPPKRRQLPDGDPRHGTNTGYRWWRCRCPACRTAGRNYDNRRNPPGTQWGWDNLSSRPSLHLQRADPHWQQPYCRARCTLNDFDPPEGLPVCQTCAKTGTPPTR